MSSEQSTWGYRYVYDTELDKRKCLQHEVEGLCRPDFPDGRADRQVLHLPTHYVFRSLRAVNILMVRVLYFHHIPQRSVHTRPYITRLIPVGGILCLRFGELAYQCKRKIRSYGPYSIARYPARGPAYMSDIYHTAPPTSTDKYVVSPSIFTKSLSHVCCVRISSLFLGRPAFVHEEDADVAVSEPFPYASLP